MMGFPPPTEPARTPGPDESSLGDARTPVSKDVIAAAQSGDRDALAALWRHHAPHVTRLMLAQGLSGGTESTDRVWRRVGRTINRFHGDGEDFRRWVLAIACSVAREIRGGSRRRPQATAWHRSADALPDASVTSYLTTIAQLPVESAEAVMLRHVHGLSVADISDVIGEPEGVVRKRLRDGTKQLRAALGQVDAEGNLLDGRTESVVTEPLRRGVTPGELIGESRGVDVVVGGMQSPASAPAVPASSKRRRAVALVAAGAMLLAGIAAMSSLVRGGGSGGDSAATPSVQNSTSATQIVREGSPTAQRGEVLEVGGPPPTPPTGESGDAEADPNPETPLSIPTTIEQPSEWDDHDHDEPTPRRTTTSRRPPVSESPTLQPTFPTSPTLPSPVNAPPIVAPTTTRPTTTTTRPTTTTTRPTTTTTRPTTTTTRPTTTTTRPTTPPTTTRPTSTTNPPPPTTNPPPPTTNPPPPTTNPPPPTTNPPPPTTNAPDVTVPSVTRPSVTRPTLDDD